MKNDALVQIHCLQQYAMDHQATNHPYLITLANGEYPDPMEALKDFSIQYQGYTAWFPKYLTAAMSKLEQHQHRLWLIENLSEESGILEDEEIKMDFQVAKDQFEKQFIIQALTLYKGKINQTALKNGRKNH